MTTMCDKFCRDEYVVQVDQQNRENAEKYNYPYTRNRRLFSDCKRSFCNPTCKSKGRFYKQYETQIRKFIKKGFHRSYSQKQMKKLKEKGALSGCFNTGYLF